MKKPLSSVRRAAQGIWSRALRRVERPLPEYAHAHFQPAPPALANCISGAQINRRDNVHCWFEGRRRASFGEIAHPGVFTIRDAGLIGRSVTGRDKKTKAIVSIADDRGLPLFFPFKKAGDWNIANSLMGLTLIFGRRPAGKSRKYALLGSASVSFYHFLTEVVGDWWFLKRMGFTDSDFACVVVHGQGLPWQEEILDMLGISKEKRRYHFQVDEKRVDLVLPFRTKANADSVPSWMCEALWTELGAGLSAGAATRKVILSRKTAPRRRMLNVEELTAPLKRMGFEVVQLDGMTIAEQQALFASSRLVVAEHGAALTNLVWCPPSALVVDIHRDSVAAACFKILAELRGVRYAAVFAAASETLDYGDWRISEEAVDRVCRLVAEELELAGFPDGDPSGSPIPP
jgi:hypothetical protein